MCTSCNSVWQELDQFFFNPCGDCGGKVVNSVISKWVPAVYETKKFLWCIPYGKELLRPGYWMHKI